MTHPFRHTLRLVISVLLLLCSTTSLHAVLKEKDLNATLTVLRAELESTYKEQKQNIARYNSMNGAQHKQMVQMMQKSDLISLMLYSQKQDFTFDMTYACHEATTLYREFNQRHMPYKKIMARLDQEEQRYQALISALQNIPPRIGTPQAVPDSLLPKALKGIPTDAQPFTLDEQGQSDRAICLNLAKALLANIQMLKASINADNEHYKMTSQKLKKLNDYALERYQGIQKNIFVNGDASYLEILSAFSQYANNAKEDVNEKYGTENVTQNGKTQSVKSQWRGPIVTGLSLFVIFYIVVSAILGYGLIRWIAPRLSRIAWLRRRFASAEDEADQSGATSLPWYDYINSNAFKKNPCVIMTTAMLIFAISVMIARTAMNHNFFLMASKLLIEYAWLLSVIFISLLVRLDSALQKKGFQIYTPMMLMAFIIITFRIIFIPNNLVQLIFPPILLLFTLWQWWMVRKHHAALPATDTLYAWISLLVMTGATAVAWYGYTLLSVQLLIWWMFQLSCIQTVTCLYDILKDWEIRKTRSDGRRSVHDIRNEKNVGMFKMFRLIRKYHEPRLRETWLFDLVYTVIVPVLAVFSILFSIWWSASVFDLTETVMNIFLLNFLNVEGIVQLSLAKIVFVGSLYFVFSYIGYVIKAAYHNTHQTQLVVNGKPNFTLANNIIAICVWGLYFIIAINMLKIPSTAISVISAGLATGVGFAMKDLLENFFYGISLMTGRVRVGDFIECDGIRGKVDSISYQSTQVLTSDGCIIAFLNSSLFSKNFKNITKNHDYEWVSVPVGVAYGTDVPQVRAMLTAAVREQLYCAPDGRPVVDESRPIDVVFTDFGDNSVNLNVTYWALVEQKYAITARIKEAIYNTLNAHGIEIPYPQRDVHIRTVQTPAL